LARIPNAGKAKNTMIRKIIVNLLVAFFIFPTFIFIKDLIIIDVEYYPYDLDRNSLVDYLYVFWNHYFDFLIPIMLSLLILLPFQLIKDGQYRRGTRYSFARKWIILMSLFSGAILLWGSFSNIWVDPWWKNLYYLLFVALFGLSVNGLLYLFIDRRIEKY
jgi:hypothetical protein